MLFFAVEMQASVFFCLHLEVDVSPYIEKLGRGSMQIICKLFAQDLPQNDSDLLTCVWWLEQDRPNTRFINVNVSLQTNFFTG